MPKIRRFKLPQPLLIHLLTRMRQRNLSSEQIILLTRWLDSEPEVPERKWYKKFPASPSAAKANSSKPFCFLARRPTGVR